MTGTAEVQELIQATAEATRNLRKLNARLAPLTERRAISRYRHEEHVLLGARGTGRMTDLGAGGMGIVASAPLGKGVRIQVTLAFPDDPVILPAVVRWCHQDEKGGWRLGLQFLEVTQALRDRLVVLSRNGTPPGPVAV